MKTNDRLYLHLEACLLFLAGWVPAGLGTWVRRLLYVPFFSKCGKAFRAGNHAVIQGFRNINMGNNVCLNRHTSLYAARGRISLGNNVFLGDFSSINASNATIRIGNNVAIGPMTIIQGANHAFERLDIPIIQQGHVPSTVTVEDNVWIGAHCTITPGVHIATGVVVGAGAVVTKDIPKNAVVGGVPAKILRYREG